MGEINVDIEVLELAISREIDAYHFYMALARWIEKPTTSKIFEGFATEELEHKAKLELEILKAGQKLPENREMPDPSRDYIISDDISMTDMAYRDILLLGMEKEESAFRFYIDLLSTVTDPQSRETLLAIAEQEVEHKLRFEREYDALLKDR